MVWLNQKVQPILSELSVLSFCMMYHSLLHNMLVGDLECAFVALERSPPHFILYLLYFSTKKQKQKKQKTSKGSTGLNTKEPNFINHYLLLFNYDIMILLLLLLYYYYYLFIYYVYYYYFVCSPNFLYSSKAKVKL